MATNQQVSLSVSFSDTEEDKEELDESFSDAGKDHMAQVNNCLW